MAEQQGGVRWLESGGHSGVMEQNAADVARTQQKDERNATTNETAGLTLTARHGHVPAGAGHGEQSKGI